jgi:hypothetical protein
MGPAAPCLRRSQRQPCHVRAHGVLGTPLPLGDGQYAVGVDLVLEPFGEGLARVDG